MLRKKLICAVNSKQANLDFFAFLNISEMKRNSKNRRNKGRRLGSKNASVVDTHWFRSGSGPAFYLDADPDPDPRSEFNVDLCGSGYGSWSNFKVKKSLIFYMKYTQIGNTLG
jgi:hypothetical protein